jgi:hypothetical protein
MTAPIARGTVTCMDSADLPSTPRCRIVIRGRLSDRLASAFPEMALQRRPGRTVMRGAAEPAHLHELLERLRDLGLEPLSVDVEE